MHSPGSRRSCYLVQANWVHGSQPEAHCAMRKTGSSSLVLFTRDATATVSTSSYHGVTSCGLNQRCAIFYDTGRTVPGTRHACPVPAQLHSGVQRLS